MPSELSDMVSNTQIPELDSAISAASQEGIEGIIVTERPLVKFDCVSVPLVAVIDRAQDFVFIGIVYDQLFI